VGPFSLSVLEFEAPADTSLFVTIVHVDVVPPQAGDAVKSASVNESKRVWLSTALKIDTHRKMQSKNLFISQFCFGWIVGFEKISRGWLDRTGNIINPH